MKECESALGKLPVQTHTHTHYTHTHTLQKITIPVRKTHTTLSFSCSKHTQLFYKHTFSIFPSLCLNLALTHTVTHSSDLSFSLQSSVHSIHTLTKYTISCNDNAHLIHSPGAKSTSQLKLLLKQSTTVCGRR